VGRTVAQCPQIVLEDVRGLSAGCPWTVHQQFFFFFLWCVGIEPKVSAAQPLKPELFRRWHTLDEICHVAHGELFFVTGDSMLELSHDSLFIFSRFVGGLQIVRMRVFVRFILVIFRDLEALVNLFIGVSVIIYLVLLLPSRLPGSNLLRRWVCYLFLYCYSFLGILFESVRWLEHCWHYLGENPFLITLTISGLICLRVRLSNSLTFSCSWCLVCQARFWCILLEYCILCAKLILV
jgi:hypothetical protein